MYKPSEKILDKYADLMVNFALNDCKGIRKGDVVLVSVPECAKPFLISIRRAIMKAGGNMILKYSPDNIEKEGYELSNKNQLKFFPEKYLKGLLDEADHYLMVIADTDLHELEGISPEKIMSRERAYKPWMKWRNEKENKGKFSWTLCMYGTSAMAEEAGMSLEEYWKQIIDACYLNEKNPVSKWKKITGEIDMVKARLNKLKIEKVHVMGAGIDLVVGLGEGRRWLGGSGANIPSYEIYISPDCRKTEGKISFNQPLYRYGNLIEGVKLEFKNGRVVKASAKKGEKVLKEMIKTKGADRIGEFSLTDGRLSKVTKFMAETLFDENRGGKYGNMHVALGKAYQDSHPKNPSKVKKNEWKKLGYNESVVHTDIVSTEKKEVTAYLKNGKEVIIYKDGRFLV